MAQEVPTATGRSRVVLVTSFSGMILRLRDRKSQVTLEFRFGVRASLRRNLGCSGSRAHLR
jgi:hypothetical protein